MNQHSQIAAPQTPCAIPSIPTVEARRDASLILPSWANCAQGRSLITAIKAERPARTVDDACGFKSVRYLGRNAAQLRGMFDRTFDMMLQDADNQRDALVAWRKANNADALIARALGETL